MRAGTRPIVWRPTPQERAATAARGLEAMSGDMRQTLMGPGGRFEELTGVCFLTDEDDFHAVAELTVARDAREHLHRLAPVHRERDLVAPYLDRAMLFGPELTGPALTAPVGSRPRDPA